MSDPEDHELGVPARQGAARHESAGEAEPSAEQSPMTSECEEEVRRSGPGGAARDGRDGPVDPADVRPGAGADPRASHPGRLPRWLSAELLPRVLWPTPWPVSAAWPALRSAGWPSEWARPQPSSAARRCAV